MVSMSRGFYLYISSWEQLRHLNGYSWNILFQIILVANMKNMVSSLDNENKQFDIKKEFSEISNANK